MMQLLATQKRKQKQKWCRVLGHFRVYMRSDFTCDAEFYDYDEETGKLDRPDWDQVYNMRLIEIARGKIIAIGDSSDTDKKHHQSTTPEDGGCEFFSDVVVLYALWALAPTSSIPICADLQELIQEYVRPRKSWFKPQHVRRQDVGCGRNPGLMTWLCCAWTKVKDAPLAIAHDVDDIVSRDDSECVMLNISPPRTRRYTHYMWNSSTVNQ